MNFIFVFENLVSINQTSNIQCTLVTPDYNTVVLNTIATKSRNSK